LGDADVSLPGGDPNRRIVHDDHVPSTSVRNQGLRTVDTVIATETDKGTESLCLGVVLLAAIEVVASSDSLVVVR
jgi:hypothetical protein